MDYFDILLAKKLNGGGGGDIDLQTLTVTENGEQDAPSGVAYNKVITNVPAPSNAIYKQTLSNLPQPIATFTGADAPIDSLKASIVGVQEGSGDPSPSNVRPITGWSSCVVNRTGKNLYAVKYTPRTYQSLTISVSDGVLSVAGTIGSSNLWSVSDGSTTQSDCLFFKAGTYTINKTNVSGIRYYPRALGSSESLGYSTRIESLTFTLTNDTWVYVNVRVDSGFSSETPVTLDIQIERGEEETTFEPYSGNTYTIPFKDSSDNPITVYGGGIDVSGGKLTVTHANIASYNGESINEPWISSEDVYTQGATPTTGAQVVYPLTTPLVYDFDPLALRSNGVTNISVDCGEVTECKFLSETP